MLRPTLYEVVHDLAHFFQAFPSWGSFQKLVTRVPDNHHEQFAYARLYDVDMLFVVYLSLSLFVHFAGVHCCPLEVSSHVPSQGYSPRAGQCLKPFQPFHSCLLSLP